MSDKCNPNAPKLLVDPSLMATAAAEPWAGSLFPGADMASLVEQMRQITDRVKAGDLADIEAMLVNQALTLQAMFTNLSRRAAQQEYVPSLQAMLGLALKTQTACRQTIEAIGELKNPRAAVIFGQANIAHQQVVSNGTRPASLAQAASPTLENELSQAELERIPREGG